MWSLISSNAKYLNGDIEWRRCGYHWDPGRVIHPIWDSSAGWTCLTASFVYKRLEVSKYERDLRGI